MEGRKTTVQLEADEIGVLILCIQVTELAFKKKYPQDDSISQLLEKLKPFDDGIHVFETATLKIDD